MSKAILILSEMPAKCLVCNFRGIRDCHCCFAENASIPRMIDDIYSRPDWCPLRNAPESIKPLYDANAEQIAFAEGYNACVNDVMGDAIWNEFVDEILGEDNNARDN